MLSADHDVSAGIVVELRNHHALGARTRRRRTRRRSGIASATSLSSAGGGTGCGVCGGEAACFGCSGACRLRLDLRRFGRGSAATSARAVVDEEDAADDDNDEDDDDEEEEGDNSCADDEGSPSPDTAAAVATEVRGGCRRHGDSGQLADRVRTSAIGTRGSTDSVGR